MQRAKERDLWALGHPRELGGQGLPFMDYVRINEVIGRSFWAMQALGTLSLQDSLMVHQHGGALWRERYLLPMIAGDSIGRAHVCTPVTNAHLECLILLVK